MTATIASPGTVRIGTRGSALAMVQAGLVAEALRAAGATARIDTIVTDGDRRSPDTPWGEGAFVGAIEESLLAGDIDVAVHSAKDVPTDEHPRLVIAAYLSREEANDVLVLPGGRGAISLDDLPPGARVGTDSPRRTAFLLALRPDLRLHPLHGNVDTRLRRLDEGATDALVLAAAGLRRLGRADRISLVLSPVDVPPAPGQGALVVQVRAVDEAMCRIVGALDEPDTRRAVGAERSLLRASGGGCRTPLGAVGSVRDGRLVLRAGYARPDGRIAVRTVRDGDDTSDAADVRVVGAVLGDLADLAAIAACDLGAPRVVVTRARDDGAATILALVDRGLAPVPVPTIETVAGDPAAADDLVAWLPAADWVVVTSAHAVAPLVAAALRTGARLDVAGPRWAAVGAATERALSAAGIAVSFRPARSTAAELAMTLPVVPGQTVLLPRSDLADATLPDRLAVRGALPHPFVVYRTIEAPATSRSVFEAVLSDRPSAVIATSGSTVRGWEALARASGVADAIRAIGVIAVGPSTAAEARRHGLAVLAQADSPDPGAIADAAAAAIRTLQETP